MTSAKRAPKEYLVKREAVADTSGAIHIWTDSGPNHIPVLTPFSTCPVCHLPVLTEHSTGHREYHRRQDRR